MSADNWARCPICVANAHGEAHRKVQKAKEAYGVADAEEYLKLLEESKRQVETPTTLREDYYIGMDNSGTFKVSYGCTCDKCGFSHNFTHEEQIKFTGSG